MEKNQQKIFYLGLALVFIILVFVFFTQNPILPNEKSAIKTLQKIDARPKLEEYPVPNIFSETPASVDFSSDPRAREFQSVISEQAKTGPNFSGHYTVVEWGCGNNCQSNAIVDAITGKLVVYDIHSTAGTKYDISSRLFIINPHDTVMENTPGHSESTQYYFFDGEKLNFLGNFDFETGNEIICEGEEVMAQNPINNIIELFATECHVPQGWKKLE